MKPTKIAEGAIKILNKRITNEIFLIIQNDKKLMRDYLEAVHEQGHENVNRAIGKQIKKSYNLTDFNEEEKNPSSSLILSHTKFE